MRARRLKDEMENLPGLHFDAVARRVGHFLNGAGSVDDYELELHLSKPKTIGVADLEDGEERILGINFTSTIGMTRQ